MCGVVWAYTGDTPEAAFAPIRAQFGPPALDWVGPIPHPALNSMFDGLYPAGDQWYWKADFVKEIPDEAVDIHVQYAAAAADLEIDDAPLSDRWRGGPGAARTPRPGTTGMPSGAWSSSGSAPIRPTTST